MDDDVYGNRQANEEAGRQGRCKELESKAESDGSEGLLFARREGGVHHHGNGIK